MQGLTEKEWYQEASNRMPDHSHLMNESQINYIMHMASIEMRKEGFYLIK